MTKAIEQLLEIYDTATQIRVTVKRLMKQIIDLHGELTLERLAQNRCMCQKEQTDGSTAVCG